MRHIGLFGGSFNPVHCGHLLAADSVRTQLGLDEIRILPAARSPFKDKPEISDRHRVAMLERAFAGTVGFTLDTRELDRTGVSYTIDTVTEFTREYPRDHLYLLIGMDAWNDFEDWKQWQRILDHCHLVVVTRPGFSAATLSPDWQQRHCQDVNMLRQARAGKLFFAMIPASNAASNEIREQIARGVGTGDALDDAVKDYIKQQQLYQ